MKQNFLFLLAFSLLAINSVSAQLTEQKKAYTRADTLRGGNRPERSCYDVTFYELNIKIDTVNRSISGSNKIAFTALQDFKTLQIDLFDTMKIVSIQAPDGRELNYRRELNAVFVDMPEVISKGTRSSITVSYYGKTIIAKNPPWDGGFSWAHDSLGKLWIGISCEGLGASSWWPNKDYLADETDSMRIICTVPAGLKCVANGVEEKEVQNADRTTTFYWKISYPINNYNVTLNIGDYVHFGDVYTAADGSKLALDYYVLSYNLEKAKKQFEQVKPMMKCYEKYLGKYPFWNDGYALVETPYLGMEHQGAIAYGNKYKGGYAGRDYSRIGLNFDYIIIHETGHEWWGNSVSCSDLADMWIHEGFCTYSEAIYVECLYGEETAQKYVNAKRTSVGNKAPVQGTYGVNQQGNGDMYAKGMLFLNTLRHVVNNDKVWWSTIKGISDTAFKIKNTNYDEILAYVNNKTGMKLDPIFEQYLKYPKIPVLEYKLKKGKKGQYDLSYRWITDAKNFSMPVVFSTPDKPAERINATNDWQTTSITLKKDKFFKMNEDLFYIKTDKVQ